MYYNTFTASFLHAINSPRVCMHPILWRTCFTTWNYTWEAGNVKNCYWRLLFPLARPYRHQVDDGKVVFVQSSLEHKSGGRGEWLITISWDFATGVKKLSRSLLPCSPTGFTGISTNPPLHIRVGNILMSECWLVLWPAKWAHFCVIHTGHGIRKLEKQF